jgi:glutathione S-transferase
MILYYTPNSPFSRKVMVLAWERHLVQRLQLEMTLVGTNVPLASAGWERLAPLNPLMKIPTLVTDDGETLFDSRLICEYLDALDGAPVSIPASGPSRWFSLRTQVVADGIVDAALLCRFEAARTQEWKQWVELQRRRIMQGLATLEEMASRLEQTPFIGEISVGSALGYLDFRFADINWRDACPSLEMWFNKFSERYSMRATRPATEWEVKS